MSNKLDNPIRCLVGVGVIIVERKHMLVGVRQGSHCAGLLSFPGGHLESCDASIEICGERECKEEILDPRTGEGLDVEILPVAPGQPQVFLRYDIMEGSKPYTTLFMLGRLREPGIDLSQPMPSREPHKCAEWNWRTLGDLVSYHMKDSSDQLEETKPWIPLDLLVRNQPILKI